MYALDDPQFIALVEKGLPFPELEKRLQPAAHSQEGFLGKDENLMQRVYEDWKIVESSGTSHTAIASALRRVIDEKYQLHENYEYRKPFVTTAGNQDCPWDCKAEGKNAGAITQKNLSKEQEMILGGQGVVSPIIFLQNGITLLKRVLAEEPHDSNLKQQLETTERALRLAWNPTEIFYVPLTSLLPHLIEEHYFFEGTGTSFRADPKFLIQALRLQKT